MADRPADLRLLTVKQPHAWAITAGLKDVENRTWPFPYPVPTTIGIHAGKGHDRHGLEVATLTVPDDLPRGMIVALVDVVDDHSPAHCRNECSPWAVPHHRHWRLANVRTLRWPIPCRGSLWLFKPAPPSVARRLAGQVDVLGLADTLALRED